MPLGIWAGMTGHRWTVLLVVVAYFAVSMLILPKFPSPIAYPLEPRGTLTLLASGLRFIGFALAISCAIALFSFPFLRQPLPPWLAVPLLLWWALWACSAFWGSKWIKRKALETKQPDSLGDTAALFTHDNNR